MDHSSGDGYATMPPVPAVNQLKRLVIRVLFNVDPNVQFVSEVPRLRQ